MTRVLFWLALALLIYFAFRSKQKQAQRRAEQAMQRQRAAQQQQQQQQVASEAMLCCAHCGVYFPASENVPAGGRDYCSPAHAPAH
jgi:uncharacterized protein